MVNEHNKRFSKYNRALILEKMAEEPLDLLVIGGGITGCGIALDAVLRGLKVGLVEMQDFAAGTSSRSTKLIHGGLRYLKQGEIKLVREVGKERAILYRNAPHLVIPEPMLLPLVKGGTYGKLATSVGLMIYDYLAGVEKVEHRKMLNFEETCKREPLLKQDGLKGGGLYVEYRTDDARLTIEVIKKAVALGANAVNYAKVEQFIYNDKKINGAVVKDQIGKKEYQLYAKKIVNATGPWVDELRQKDRSLHGKRLHLTKGVHIVVDQKRFPLQQSIYFDVADGRMIFAIPRDGKTYMGTTDTNYDGDKTDPQINNDDISYLLKGVNDMFPSIQLGNEDVESHWVGIRPLIHEDGKSPSELSRKDEIIHSSSGLITIAGGKLTGYRKMAERVIDLVVKELSNEESNIYLPCSTSEQVLSGGEVGGQGMWPLFLREKGNEMKSLGIAEEQAKQLIHRYGCNIDKVISYLNHFDEETIRYNVDPLLIAELIYGLENEMVVKAEDFLIRRTGKAYFSVEECKEYYHIIRKIVEEYVNDD